MNQSLKLNRIHFPTALGLLMLVVAVILGVYFAKTKTEITPANEEALIPKQVRITNVSDTGFSASWITDKAVTGEVKYGDKVNDLKQSALDDRDQLSGEAGHFEVHHVTVKNLSANAKYYFKIESGKKQFDNNDKPFEVTTGPILASPPAADPIYGVVLTASGTAAEGAVVYINVANAAPLSAIARTDGNWALSLATARTTNLGSFLNYDTQATLVNILVQDGKSGTSSAITTTNNDSPVPDIILGKSHDFRTIAANTNKAVGEELVGPTATAGAKKSGFGLDPIVAMATPSAEVTLENPRMDGEVLNATQPAFIGSGPIGMILDIAIHSDETYTGKVTINKQGEWEYQAPKGLTPGEHTVTINYLDSKGDKQTITRNFVIAQAGESQAPAITATPSGEAARTKMPSTASGIPKPGGGDISLLMALTGLGLIIGGLKIKNIV